MPRHPVVPPPTARLAFRQMTEDDLDDMAALLGAPDVMRHYPRPRTREEAVEWIAWNRRLYRDEGFGLWVITLRDTGEFAGDCGLTPQEVDGVRELEVGYHVRTDLQSRGLATEAAGACRDFARDVLGARRLVAIIRPGNTPSQRVAAKIGLPFEKESVHAGLPVRVHATDALRGPAGGGARPGQDAAESGV
ncbi:GNAT family N-acetyltransferase [Streptomyces sp. NPDC020917]|uniref:GNAT family N-acetyltransferase n=1 Tax=Streptomyces sp. NPDC020917 TaxID=3365102 RepID=UPI00379025F2